MKKRQGSNNQYMKAKIEKGQSDPFHASESTAAKLATQYSISEKTVKRAGFVSPMQSAYLQPMLAIGTCKVGKGMALLNLTAASRAVGVNRSTIARALKNGRLSTTTNEQGERCIDTAELMRVFGVLKTDAQGDAPADAYPLHRHAIGDAQGNAQGNAQGQDALIEVLQEQLRQANEREREGRERETRLLTLLEVEQAARRKLETKLLSAPVPPPKPAPHKRVRVWLLLILLVAVLAFAGWRWRDAIHATMAALVN